MGSLDQNRPEPSLVSDRQGGAAEGAECWLLSHLALIYLCFRKISSEERHPSPKLPELWNKVESRYHQYPLCSVGPEYLITECRLANNTCCQNLHSHTHELGPGL